jgi:hypothetical protein
MEVQLEAILALKNFEDSMMIEPLIEALNAKWYSIRYSASEVLRKITNQNIGVDHDKWKSWWMINKSIFIKACHYHGSDWIFKLKISVYLSGISS